MKFIFIMNPAAGKNRKILDLIPTIQKICKKKNLDYSLHLSESGEDIIRHCKTVCESISTPLRIFCCGGDGTISQVVNGCQGFNHVEIGIFPMGTGNDFIKNFDIPIKNYLNIEKQLIAPSQQIDLIRYNNHYCINMINIGLDARVGMDMPKFKKYPLVGNKTAYNLSLLSNLTKKLGRHLEVYIDDKLTHKGEFALCSIGNGISCGGGFYITPYAKVDDGLLDVSLVIVPPRLKLKSIIAHVNKGTQFEEIPSKNYMVKYRCKSVRIVAKKVMPFVNDGEHDLFQDIQFEVVSDAVSIICPL